MGCGQACVAMLLEIEFRAACDLIGHDDATTAKELAKALSWCFDSPARLIGGPPRVSSGTSILMVLTGSKRHWAVLHEGRIFDPAPYDVLAHGGRVVSHLPLRARWTQP